MCSSVKHDIANLEKIKKVMKTSLCEEFHLCEIYKFTLFLVVA